MTSKKNLKSFVVPGPGPTLALPSIRDLVPLEFGGVINRAGISFQDHVAVSFLIEMLENPALHEVWMETQDDITLLWVPIDKLEVEFVQVKSNQFDHLWSVAELCAPASGKKTKSILEKSLDHDQICEPCRFRMVTKWPVNKALEVLTYPIGSPARQGTTIEMMELGKATSKASKLVSKNGHDSAFWVENTVWEVRHDETAIEVANIQRLQEIAQATGRTLTLSEVRTGIYAPLVTLVQDAGRADWKVDPRKKKFLRGDISSVVADLIYQTGAKAPTSIAVVMRDKMEAAQIESDYIVSAEDQRRYYQGEIYSPKYLDLSDRDRIEAEIVAHLDSLRLRMDRDEVPEGQQFFNLCVDGMKALHDSIVLKAKPPLPFFMGCMHNVTGRCGHRYRKVTK